MDDGHKNDREKILLRTSVISIIGNTVLSLFKIVAGLLSGSMAVLSDGIDSATDSLTSFVMLFTVRIMSRPPDSKYVYGYQKAESIATKLLSFIIFSAGAYMLITSIQSFFNYQNKEFPTMLAIYVTIASIVGKLLLTVYQYKQGRKVDSSMLKANAINMRNDTIVSLGVLVGLVLTFTLKMPILDSVISLVISIFIIYSSIRIFMDSNVELMDGVDDVSVYNKIFEAVDKVKVASNPHRVRSRQIGHAYMIVLDIEADGSISLNEAHAIAEEVERSIKSSVENVYDIVVHVEPKGKHLPEEKFGIDREML